jgi:hypothetical protein
VGQNYLLDAGLGWVSHSWRNNSGEISQERTVTVNEAGMYTIEAVNNNGCVAQDTFLLETSTSLLKASFLTPQEAHAGDTIVFIDVSWPLPEVATWSFPETMRKIFDNGFIVYGQFGEPGIYDIGLAATLGQCADMISKKITILETIENEEGRLGYTEFLKTFTLHPNPNDGAFEVEVELDEQSPITLSIWSIPRSILLTTVHAKGSNSYRQNFDLRPLSSGLYVIRIDHDKGTEYKRFIVH